MADLTLTYFEYVYSITHPNLYLFIPFRYMDDILVVHNRSTNDIYNTLISVYNNVLNLDITHDNDYSCNYLDMEIKISGNRLTTKLYNKTDSFNFSIKRFPHFDTNLSANIKKATIYAEILRNARTCSFEDDFVTRLLHTKRQLSESGYDSNFFNSTLFKCIHKNKFIQYKYDLGHTKIQIKKSLCKCFD